MFSNALASRLSLFLKDCDIAVLFNDLDSEFHICGPLNLADTRPYSVPGCLSSKHSVVLRFLPLVILAKRSFTKSGVLL